MKCKKVINMQNAPCLKLSPQSTYGSNIVLLCFASFSLTTKRKKKDQKIVTCNIIHAQPS